MGSLFRSRLAHDAEAYPAIRRQSLRGAPLALGASAADDFAASPEVVREQLRHAPAWGILGPFRPALIGAVVLFRDRRRKGAHKAHLWGMSVAPSHRRPGVAAALLQAVLRHDGHAVVTHHMALHPG